MKSKADVSKGPEPKWFVLQILNVIVMATFVGSIIYVSWYYRDLASRSADNKSPLTNMFLPIMVFWSLCLAYFFGFFGISFVDHQSLTESPSQYGLDEIQRQISSQQQQQQNRTAAPAPKKKTVSTEPRHDTVVCSDSAAEKKKAEVAEKAAPSSDLTNATNEDILAMLNSGEIKDYQLEKKLGDCERAVAVRRMLYSQLFEAGNTNENEDQARRCPLELIPYTGYNYDKVFGANCEIVIGYVPIPLGVVGPLVLNGEPIYIPMATTEGCLVASTNRGCKALSTAGGVSAIVLKDAITRAPCVRMPSAMRAAALKLWVSQPENYLELEQAFNSTTNFGRLAGLEATVAGRNVYLRFSCMSGDAMGMNMVSKGCLKAIEVLEREFPDLVLIAISGNMCTDKKPAAINWILGRGKSIVVESIVPESIVKSVLKSSVHDMIETNRQKNLIGSAMAGSVGGFNAHAANIVTAVYLATGQDPAQNVESSNCLTLMELADDGKSLHVSVTMPSVEVGTVGGGTHLPAQAGCLDLCGVRGAAKGPNAQPGDNARKLAQIVGGAVLAGELSLIAALAANHLVRSHMEHNRKPAASST
eukprot:CAMPEP_0202978884 /NCGR_PEP_ID=MMETSP1396-20130829/85181_1 /ASSEMBLY_ACC=CAM_ASM_000872 /TAXON_ID= /ORGANISM="Pseudokeronopsis sp., Strain Brazil" /LENGTH=588 /DNA_ID=CAMNT_0049718055 /DNA_START=99 /DNA_END=1865 /DNA_ORIENTATION=-